MTTGMGNMLQEIFLDDHIEALVRKSRLLEGGTHDVEVVTGARVEGGKTGGVDPLQTPAGPLQSGQEKPQRTPDLEETSVRSNPP